MIGPLAVHIRDERWFFSSRDLWKTNCNHCLSLEIAIAKETPDVLAFVEGHRTDVGSLLPVKQGVEFEKMVLSSLAESLGSDFRELASSESDQTIGLLQGGIPVLAQAFLKNEFDGVTWTGYADLLVREDYDLVSKDFKITAVKVPGSADSAKYRVWDIKASSEAKPNYGTQLAGYVYALKELGLASDRNPGLVLKYDQLPDFDMEDSLRAFDAQKEKLLAAMKDADGKDLNLDFVSPRACESPSKCEGNSCNYSSLCESVLADAHDLSAIYYMGNSAQKFKDAGIHTYDELAKLQDIAEVPGIKPDALAKFMNWAQVKVKEQELGKYFELKPKTDWIELPAPSSSDIFFDIEWFNPVLSKKSWVFMFGYVNSNEEFRCLDSLSYEDEQLNFRQFVGEMLEILGRDSSAHIYHFHTPEPEHLRKLSNAYEELAEEVEFICSRMVDLRKNVVSMILPGSNSYSIKDIEKYYDADGKLHREGLVKGGDQAMLQFYEALAHREAENESEASNLMTIIRDYNKDDCLSTKLLLDWLRELAK